MTDSRRVWNFYARRGNVDVPSVAKTTAGFFMEQEPVAVISLDSRQAVVAKAAGVKSWVAFQRGIKTVSLQRDERGYRVPEYEPAPRGGLLEKGTALLSLPSDTSPREVAEHVLRLFDHLPG